MCGSECCLDNEDQDSDEEREEALTFPQDQNHGKMGKYKQ